MAFGASIAIGAGLGIVLGVFAGNVPLWLSVGAALGVVAGAVLEGQRRR